MNFIKTLFIIPILFLACNTQYKTDKTIEGNWYTCAKDGTYMEMYVSGQVFKYCMQEYGVMHETYHYQFLKDTIFYTRKDDLLNLPKTKWKAIINFSNQNTMVWYYPESDEIWELNRLDEKVLTYSTGKVDIESLTLYETVKNEIDQRARKVKCPDKRSREEITRDSLMNDELQNFF